MATAFTQDATGVATAPTTALLTFETLYTEVAEYVCNDRTPADDDLVRAKRYVNDGYARFIGGFDPRKGRVHDWSFMQPTATLAVSDEDTETALPTTFESLIEGFYYSSTDHSNAILERSPGYIYQLRAGGSSFSGPMALFAIEPKAYSATAETTYQVLWYPEADSAYTLTYRYRVKLNKLTNDNDYPYGGNLHSQTILECALAVAESRKSDVIGVHNQIADRLMAASIDADARNVPANLGYMFDSSDVGGPISHPRDDVTYE